MNAPQTPQIRPDILTYGGSYFNFIDPQNNQFHIEDIAHALAHVCRFAGHTREFYSVAQHSVLVSREIEACAVVWKKTEPEVNVYRWALFGLMHDAAEAYLGDITRPLKQLLPEYKVIERRVEAALFAAFKLPINIPTAVKQVDMRLLATEQRDLMPPHDDEWELIKDMPPLQEVINPWPPEKAKREFLMRYEGLKYSDSAAQARADKA